MNYLKTLYPPIVDTYAPTFIIDQDEEIRIYFSLSQYNTIAELLKDSEIQISIRNQNNNFSVLRKDLYPTGIKINTIFPEGDYFYTTLKNEDIDGGFAINQYYKVQLRFNSINTSMPNGGIASNSWLTTNLENFSEWSTICLLHGISKPELNIISLKETTPENPFIVKTTMLALVGSLTFEDKNEKEYLKEYKINIFNSKKEKIIDSGKIYGNSYNNLNQINYMLNRELQDGERYSIEIEILTNNLYSKIFTYNIYVLIDPVEGELQLPAKLTTETFPYLGSIKVSLESSGGGSLYTGQIVFRRTSSRSNFTVWEDIYTVYLNRQSLSFSWYDYTIESGVWYKYVVQKSTATGERGTIVSDLDLNPKMIIFEDMFLDAESQQLRIKYNRNISSYKKNLSETKIDTIGSQYPFIRKNGAVDYRSFPISGLITIHNEQDFYPDLSLPDSVIKKETIGTLDSYNFSNFAIMNKKDFYLNGDISKLYYNYNKENQINDYNDYILEREFRECVLNFLSKNNVKLLRTTQEGNILVKLMDINLTPEQGLDRLIYNFSATAYEVDSFCVANLKKYHINDDSLIKKEEQEAEKSEELKLGQLKGIQKAGLEIIQNVILKKYEPIKKENFLIKIDCLDRLRLEFQEKPYLIKETTTIDPKTQKKILSLTPLGDSVPQKEDKILLGYIAKINNLDTYIGPEGIFEIAKNTKIKTLSFPIDTNVVIDYLGTVSFSEDMSHSKDITSFFNIISQEVGIFKPEESLLQKIKRKHDIYASSFYQKVISLNGVRIEADPGTICQIWDSFDLNPKTFIISDNGILSLKSEDSIIEGLYFQGIYLSKVKEGFSVETTKIPFNKYAIDQHIYKNVSEIKNPILNMVYNINEPPIKIKAKIIENPQSRTDFIDNKYFQKLIEEKKYIYYQGHWEAFEDQGQFGKILKSVNALVDYECEVQRGVYPDEEQKQ